MPFRAGGAGRNRTAAFYLSPHVPGWARQVAPQHSATLEGNLLRSSVPASADRLADGGAYRIRTGDTCLEGRCVTADTNAPYCPHPASGEPPFTGWRHFVELSHEGLAEQVGVEPTRGSYRLSVFRTVPLGHLGTVPYCPRRCSRRTTFQGR